MANGQYRVRDDVFMYTTKSGTEITIDLDLPSDIVDRALTGDKDDAEQFEAVREWIGADFEAAYARMGALERARFIRTFFAEFGKAAGLPLGESLSSSDS